MLAQGLKGTRPCAVAALDGSPLAQRLVEDGLDIVPVRHRRGSPRILVDLIRGIDQLAVQVIDTHNPQSHLWGTLAARRAAVPRRVCTVHQDPGWIEGRPAKAILYKALLRTCAILGGRFIAVSREIRTSLEKLGIPGDQIHLGVNGVTATPLKDAGPSGALRASLGWTNAPVVAIVGRLKAVKGHAYLFEAMARLSTAHPSLRCVVVGDGPNRPSLEAMVERLALGDRVQFLGFRDNVTSILRECDALCMPSLWEGMPYAALEAASQALPIVATAVGDLPHFFTHGQTARLVPPQDVHALCRELDWLLVHPEAARAMGTAAQKLTTEKLTPERMLAETLRVYDL